MRALVVEGETIPGVGVVDGILGVAVNDSGSWIAQVEIAPQNLVVLKDGAVLQKSGDELPTGTFHFAVAPVLTNPGESGWVLAVETWWGAYFGAQAVANTLDVCDDPSLPPGSWYFTFFDAEMNDARQILASCELVTGVWPDPTSGALVRLQVDGSGALLSEQVLLKTGDVLPAGAGSVLGVSGRSSGFAINAAGDVLANAITLAGGAIMLNSTLLAQAGGQSPVLGSKWESFDGGTVALGPSGDYAFTGTLDSPSGKELLVRNGAKLVQSGDLLPSIAPFAVEPANDHDHPIFVTQQGWVWWFGTWNDPDTTRNAGFFLNGDLVVQEGVSVVGTEILAALDGPWFDFHASDNGRYLAFVAESQDGLQGAFLLDRLPEATPFSGCSPNQGTLAPSPGSAPSLGSSFAFQLGNPQSASPAAFVAVATDMVAGYPPCGLPLGTAGELLVDVSPPNPILVLGPGSWTTAGLAEVPVQIPSQVSLVGATLATQGLFVDFAAAQPLRLTDGLELEIGVY